MSYNLYNLLKIIKAYCSKYSIVCHQGEVCCVCRDRKIRSMFYFHHCCVLCNILLCLVVLCKTLSLISYKDGASPVQVCVQVCFFPNTSTWYDLQSVCSSFLDEGGQRSIGYWAVHQYWKSYCGDKLVVKLSYLHNGNSYTGKMASLNKL